MTTISGRRGLAALLCSGVAAASLLVPAAAYAGSVTVSDPEGDVVRMSIDENEFGPAPQTEVGDIVSTTADYRGRALVVRMRTLKVSKSASVVLRVKGGGQGRYFYTGLGPGGAVEGKDGPCQGASTRGDKAAATYTIRIPARCFGSPDRVRVGAGLNTFSTKREVFTVDEALRDGFPDGTKYLKLTKPVKRG